MVKRTILPFCSYVFFNYFWKHREYWISLKALEMQCWIFTPNILQVGLSSALPLRSRNTSFIFLECTSSFQPCKCFTYTNIQNSFLYLSRRKFKNILHPRFQFRTAHLRCRESNQPFLLHNFSSTLQFIPYFYVIYLTILLFDRAKRDDDRCKSK